MMIATCIIESGKIQSPRIADRCTKHFSATKITNAFFCADNEVSDVF